VTDPAIRELTEAAHCVLAWIDRKTNIGRLAAERLERALAGVKEDSARPSAESLLEHSDTSRCVAVCDHLSRCELPADHLPATRHESEHGCIFYSDVSPAVIAARTASALRRQRIAEWEAWGDSEQLARYLGAREACDAAVAAVLTKKEDPNA